MPRKLWLALLCFLCLIGGRPLFSQSRTVRFHAGGGLWLPLENRLDSGTQTGFGFSLAVIRHVDLVFDFKIGKLGILDTEHALDGELSVSPFLIAARFHLFPERNWDVYGLFGGGVTFSSIRNRDMINIPESSIRQSAKNGLGIWVGAGSSIGISPHFAVFLETTLLYSRTLITTTVEEVNGVRQEEDWPLNISLTAISVGLRYTY